MGIFNRMRSSLAAKEAEKKDKKAEEAKTAAPEATAVADAKTAAKGGVIALVANPRVSEKAAILGSKGTYVFNVPTSANKIEVRKAVEKQYKVKVVRVNMIRGEGKMVRRGKITGQRADWKKALVTLKDGQKIELHPGV